MMQATVINIGCIDLVLNLVLRSPAQRYDIGLRDLKIAELNEKFDKT